MVAEVIGGLVAGSLALLADAGHMLTDAVGVGLALLAAAFAAKPATLERTFGYQRSEILGRRRQRPPALRGGSLCVDRGFQANQ